MQHNNPAATVDPRYCADAIIDASEVIEHCFPGTKAALPDRLKVTIRVVRLLRGKATNASKQNLATPCKHTNGEATASEQSGKK